MKALNQILGSVFIVLGIAIGSSLACGCGSMPGQSLESIVGNSVNTSTVVFQGKVVGFEYRKGIHNEYMSSQRDDAGRPIGYETMVVRFRVESWWKGDLAPEITLVTDQTLNADGSTTNSSCDFNFKKDATYLVFAGLNKAAAMPGASECGLTREAIDESGSTEAIRKILGKGTLPTKERKRDPNP
ncbi:MAG: hypothetical protein ABL959_23190 [Pyrinomonadaceae bacterium]